jgi:hypothetical protein
MANKMEVSSASAMSSGTRSSKDVLRGRVKGVVWPEATALMCELAWLKRPIMVSGVGAEWVSAGCGFELGWK